MTHDDGHDSGSRVGFPPLTVRYRKRDGELTIEPGELADRSEIVIGRDRDVDVRLDTTSASREHARIVREGDGFAVLDNGSRNGTFVNGVAVDRHELRFGDVIAIGDALIRFGDAAFHDRRLSPGEFPATVPPSASPSPPAVSRSRPRLSNAFVAGLWAFLLAVVVGWWIARGFPLPGWGVLTDGTDGAVDGEVEIVLEPPAEPDPFAIASEPPIAATGQTPPSAAGDEVSGAVASIEEPSVEAPTVDAPSVGAPSVGAPSIGALSIGAPSIGAPPVDASPPVSRATIVGELETALERHFAAILERKDFADARSVATFLEAFAESDERRAYWRARAAEVAKAAAEDFHELEVELGALTAGGRAGDAVRRLLGLNRRYAGLPFYEEIIPRYVDAGLRGPEPRPSAFGSSRAEQLRERIALAVESCRFRDLAGLYFGLLALEPPVDERVKLLRSLVDAKYMERLFDEFLAKVAEARPRLSPLEGFDGRVVGADQDEITFELEFEGAAAVTDTIAWSRVTFARKWELFRSVPLSPDALVGMAAFAFRYGHEEGAHAAILRLKRQEQHSELADRVLALHLGVPIPDGGFVEYRGRLVEPAYRDAEIARRERIAEEERRAREEMRRLKKENRLGAFVALAKDHRQRGNFQTGDAILTAIARRFPSTSSGSEARRLADDPLLRVISISETGPSSNRLDIYFLGEGYQRKDDQQESFVHRARAALELLLMQEPYREYERCFNFWAVNLGSEDLGTDREPGSVRKDTPLDGKVEYDRFSVDNARVRRVLARVGPGGEDGQAVVIGNTSAGVATGGGGVSCVSKVSISVLAHELGHSIAGLLDEYDYEPGTNPNRRANVKREMQAVTRAVPPNLMFGSDRDDVIRKALWRDWIEAGESAWWNGAGVSAFEGGNLRRFNYYRPQATCKMRSAGARFCVVCMERMLLSLYRYVRPIDRVDPDPATTIRLTTAESAVVKVWPIHPRSHLLRARWKLETAPERQIDGDTTVFRDPVTVKTYRFGRLFDPDGHPVEFAVVNGRELKPGSYRLSVVVEDPTPWVLRAGDRREGERAEKLGDSREWRISVKGADS